MPDFKAQLGHAAATGLLDPAQRLAQLQPGRNPYVTGTALAANSPVFVGRRQALHEILGTLRRPERPGNVSVLGERRIGKSSLLNQVYQALASEPDLLSVHATAQDWNQNSQQQFYRHLHACIAEALGLASADAVDDYPAFRDFIAAQASQGTRFVLLIDEFEVMAGNERFDHYFFENLRALADKPDNRFGYLVASRAPLKQLCREHRIDASSFWNIFGQQQVLGLLHDDEAEDLAARVMQQSLPTAHPLDSEALWRHDIRPHSGNHPALIQIACSAYWYARDGGYAADSAAIQARLREYLEDFWYQRRREELAVLICAAAGERVAENACALDLRRRGLLDVAFKPFCPAFKKVIQDSLPKGKTLKDAVADLAKDRVAVKAFFKELSFWSQEAGKVYSAFKGQADADDTEA